MPRFEAFSVRGMKDFLIKSLQPKSESAYRRQIDSYVDFCLDSSLEIDDSSSVAAYIQDMHDCGFATSTLWSTSSILVSYFQFGWGEVLKENHPTLSRKLVSFWGSKESAHN